MRLAGPVLAALCAALLLAAPAQARSVPHGWLGVQADGPLTEPGNAFDSEWSLMAASGVETVRTAFDWSVAQPTADAIDLAPTDAVVLAAARRRLRILPVVHRTPGWAALRPSDGPGSPPRGTATYTRFLTALVARYGPHGSLWEEHQDVPRMAIRDWQVWNEPNFPFYWTTQPFAKPYVKLLRASRRALKAADPGARVILAGLANESWTALRAIYRAGGRGSFDAVALHPYTARPRSVLRIAELARRATRSFHDGHVPIWITELSWPAAKGKTRLQPGYITNERGQTTRLRAGLRLLASNRRRLRIAKVIWYTWLSREGPDIFGWAGLRRERAGRIVDAASFATFKRTARRLER